MIRKRIRLFDMSFERAPQRWERRVIQTEHQLSLILGFSFER